MGYSEKLQTLKNKFTNRTALAIGLTLIFGFLLEWYVFDEQFYLTVICSLLFFAIVARFIIKFSFFQMFHLVYRYLKVKFAYFITFFVYMVLLVGADVSLGRAEFREASQLFSDLFADNLLIAAAMLALTIPIINYKLEPYLEDYFLSLEKDSQVLRYKLQQNILHNEPRIVGKVLARGVDVNEALVDGFPPLLLAVAKERTSIASLLLEAGADINYQNNQGETALMIAAEKANIALVKLLLEKGADVNLVDEQGRTAIDCVKDTNNKELLNLLKSKQIKIIDL